MKEMDVAIEAAKESGKILNKYFRTGVRAETKSDNTPVTKADRESEQKIVSMIREHFPDHNFLGEEFSYEKTDSKYKWIIDPLDMTKNFIRGVPFFSNYIALEKDSEIIAGVINIPAMNILAYAELGKGAFVNGKEVNVSNTNDLSDAYIVFGDINREKTEPYTKQFFELIDRCKYNRGYGDAIGYVLLAQGHVDIVFDRGKPWDIAAAKIIVEEAGGRMTDFEGNGTIYSGSGISTNGKLHDEVVRILSK